MKKTALLFSPLALWVVPALAGPQDPVIPPPSPLKQGNAADAPKLTPEEQQRQFVLPDGFTVELVTSELQGTEKPVALNFDDAGRLWTMTATEYPLDTNDPGHADEARRKWKEGGKDRILVIDEPLKQGPHTPRVFAGGLVMPMSVLPYQDGAIVAHGPDMLLLRDTDHDGTADQRKVLLSGFGIQDSHTMAHQLMWLPDGSIFTTQGVLDSGGIADAGGNKTDFNYGKFASFRPDGTGFRLIGAGLNNTWGVLLQRDGRLWVQEANSFDHAIAPFEEGVHYHGWNEQPYLKDAPWQPGVGEVDLGSTGLSGLALSGDRAGGFPPEWQKVMLIANAVTGTINSVTADPKAEGGWKVTRGTDLMTCKDPRFRPVHLAFGPDACLYIVDWYNPVISHNEVARDHPARDKSSGRIWRVRHSSQTQRSMPNVAAAQEADLLQHLRSPNTWEMRAAWHQIVERKASALIPGLVSLLRDSSGPDDLRIHALWCLAGLQYFDDRLWIEIMQQQSGSDPAHLRPTSAELAFELVRSLRRSQPSTRNARMFLHIAAERPEPRVRREIARYLQTSADPGLPEIAAVIDAYAPPAAGKQQGVQGETLTWAAYEQAFLNSQLERILDLQPAATASLAGHPGLLARIPAAVRALIERRGYSERFANGSIAAAELETEGVRSAAFACAETSPAASALLREFIETSTHQWDIAQEILNSSTLTPAALRTFANALALKLMTAPDPEMWAGALDLAANACSAADSAEFVWRARAILAKRPALLLPVVRSALSAGIRDARFFSEIAQQDSAGAASRAAAWTGWFESAPAAEKPEIEAALRGWSAGLPAATLTDVLTELASTTTGSHFALNNVFPALLAQDAFTLPRLADELSERVPGHARLAGVQDLVQRQRGTRSAENARRIMALTSALDHGTLKPDKAAGAPLFTSVCLACHSAGGHGIGFAPPLDGSSKRDVSPLLTALLEPEAAVENVFRPFQVRLRDGTTVEGFLKAREGNRLSIQTMGGAQQPLNLLRAHSARYLNGHSVMPPLAAGLTDQQVADLLEFVRGL